MRFTLSLPSFSSALSFVLAVQFVQKKEGREAIPQVEFWTSLPGLVKVRAGIFATLVVDACGPQCVITQCNWAHHSCDVVLSLTISLPPCSPSTCPRLLLSPAGGRWLYCRQGPRQVIHLIRVNLGCHRNMPQTISLVVLELAQGRSAGDFPLYGGVGTEESLPSHPRVPFRQRAPAPISPSASFVAPITAMADQTNILCEVPLWME